MTSLNIIQYEPKPQNKRRTSTAAVSAPKDPLPPSLPLPASRTELALDHNAKYNGLACPPQSPDVLIQQEEATFVDIDTINIEPHNVPTKSKERLLEEDKDDSDLFCEVERDGWDRDCLAAKFDRSRCSPNNCPVLENEESDSGTECPVNLSDDEWEVKKIIGKKIVGEDVCYKIQWRHSWVRREALNGAQELLRAYEKRRKARRSIQMDGRHQIGRVRLDQTGRKKRKNDGNIELARKQKRHQAKMKY